MKKRGLLSNVLYVVILVTLVCFLLVQFDILGLGEQAKTAVSTILLVLAVASVAMVEIVFPVLDNKELLKEKKYVIMIAVKSVLFLASLAVLFLYEPFGVIKDTAVAIVGFVVFYFIQFFISLDPKPAVEDEEYEDEEADDEEYSDEEDADVSDMDVSEADFESDEE